MNLMNLKTSSGQINYVSAGKTCAFQSEIRNSFKAFERKHFTSINQTFEVNIPAIQSDATLTSIIQSVLSIPLGRLFQRALKLTNKTSCHMA